MPDIADLDPGYASHWIDTSEAIFFSAARSALLALWGTTGLPAIAGIDALAAWRDWATDVRGFAIDSGHYVPEENPDATAKALLEFFAAR